MKRSEFLALLGAGFSHSASGQGQVYPHRWVYVSRGLASDQEVEDIRGIARTAAEHGLNGLVFAGGLDGLSLQPPAYLDRLSRVKGICEEYQLELIPEFFSVGYGGLLGHNRNLAEGIPVKDALFVVAGSEARLAPDPPVAFVNGGLEDYEGNRVKGYQFHDQPGEVSFVDTQVFKEGAVSLRFENFTSNPYGHGRIMQEIPVRPRRCYRVTCWVKTEELAPAGVFKLQALAESGRALAPWEPQAPATADWRKLTLGFNSWDLDKVRVYAGAWGARSGKFWVDDFRIEEVGLVNVLRRPGTPVTVRSEETGLVYTEGPDYLPIVDPNLTFRFDHDAPPIRVLPGSRIRNGERLRVDYYHGMSVYSGQVTTCMSEPQVYDIWREQVRLVHRLLAPRKYLLSMDEIRAGGSCQACKQRELSMAQILGDCFTRQVEMIREQNPEAEVYTWSDMLDPNHNAHGDYYLVEGDFTGSWEYVPKDLGIVCWYYARRRESLAHFSGLGFRTAAGAYYDGDTLDNPKGWLEALDETPGACGIMYTTWQNKYELLGPFGDLVSQGDYAAGKENQKAKGKNQKAKMSDPDLGPGWGRISTVWPQSRQSSMNQFLTGARKWPPRGIFAARKERAL